MWRSTTRAGRCRSSASGRSPDRWWCETPSSWEGSAPPPGIRHPPARQSLAPPPQGQGGKERRGSVLVRRLLPAALASRSASVAERFRARCFARYEGFGGLRDGYDVFLFRKEALLLLAPAGAHFVNVTSISSLLPTLRGQHRTAGKKRRRCDEAGSDWVKFLHRFSTSSN